MSKEPSKPARNVRVNKNETSVKKWLDKTFLLHVAYRLPSEYFSFSACYLFCVALSNTAGCFEVCHRVFCLFGSSVKWQTLGERRSGKFLWVLLCDAIFLAVVFRMSLSRMSQLV